MIQHNITIEQISFKFLEFIACDDELASNFFMNTGLQPQNLRNELEDKDFYNGIMQYLMEDEKLLLQFCDYANINPMQMANLYAFLTKQYEI